MFLCFKTDPYLNINDTDKVHFTGSNLKHFLLINIASLALVGNVSKK